MTRSAPKVLATICARGGSKGIPNKNILDLHGRPLISYTLECARLCPAVGHVVVSTDSDEIASVVERLGVSVPFRRPAELASDSAPKIGAIRHATEYVEQHEGFRPDIVVDLDISVPLRTPDDVVGCIDLIIAHDDLDAAVSIYEPDRNPYYTMVEPDGDRIRLSKQPARGIIRRQDVPPVYGVSGSVFAYRRSSLSTIEHLYAGAWGGYLIPRERAIEVDNEVDLKFVEIMMSRIATEAPA